MKTPDFTPSAYGHSAPAHGITNRIFYFLVLALTVCLGFTTVGSFSTVQEAAKAELHLSDYQLGLVQGLAPAVPLLLLSIPIGLATDRRRRVTLLLFLAVACVIGTFLTGVANGFAALFVARMLTAIGMTGALTVTSSLSADMCRPVERGRASLLIQFGKTLGQGAAFFLVGALFVMFSGYVASAGIGGLSPWRATHLALAALGCAIIVPVLFLREPERHESMGRNRSRRALLADLASRKTFLLPLFVGELGIIMVDMAASIWAAPVLSRRFGLQPGDFAGWMGLLFFASGALGTILGGLAVDMGLKKAWGGRGVLGGAVIAAAIGVPAALFPIAPSPFAFAVALAVLMLSGAVAGVVMAASFILFLPNELRGLCTGAFMSFAGLIAFGVTPTLVVFCSQLLGGESHLDQGLAIIGTIVGVTGLAGFGMAFRRAPVPIGGEK
ncbi:MAG TPA: MFS transporter [Sphingobium sp.]|nr:MFS transporter [Sphingobium sp.]